MWRDFIQKMNRMNDGSQLHRQLTAKTIPAKTRDRHEIDILYCITPIP